MRTTCVLCLSCANFTGRKDGERRRQFPRLCAAGLVLGPTQFHCESYVPKRLGSPSLPISRVLRESDTAD
jgi:hypothetical protein